MVDDVDDEQAVKVVTIAWALWNNWNVVGEKNGKALVQWAMNYIMEYNEAVAVSKESTQVAEFADPWRPPQASWYKANIDGAVFSAQKAVGAGVLIRDDKGRVEAALSKKIMASMGAVEVEVNTFEAGMLLAKDTGVEDLVLEGDSVMVLNALIGKSTPPSSVEAVVLGMQEMAKDFR
ncbi:uncharacterized protein LOC136068724 [Quercus suber]|uniref:uncharacterized protein LOC136068724 n=1 Tax=Quercus suber TaxID=58331 RepID=UPI0032DE914B